MTEHFLTYEQSLAVKELGFPYYPFSGWYKNKEFTLSFSSLYEHNEGEEIEIIKAPLKSQFFKWAREKYNYNCFVVSSSKDGKWYYFREDLSDRHNDSEPELTPKFDTYEQAENACINKLIELLK